MSKRPSDFLHRLADELKTREKYLEDHMAERSGKDAARQGALDELKRELRDLRRDAERAIEEGFEGREEFSKRLQEDFNRIEEAIGNLVKASGPDNG